jgi:hypothetical protein
MNIYFRVNKGFGSIEDLLTKVSMSNIPRVGEFVTSKGIRYVVSALVYDLDSNNCEIILKPYYAYAHYKEDEK